MPAVLTLQSGAAMAASSVYIGSTERPGSRGAAGEVFCLDVRNARPLPNGTTYRFVDTNYADVYVMPDTTYHDAIPDTTNQVGIPDATNDGGSGAALHPSAGWSAAPVEVQCGLVEVDDPACSPALEADVRGFAPNGSPYRFGNTPYADGYVMRDTTSRNRTANRFSNTRPAMYADQYCIEGGSKMVKTTGWTEVELPPNLNGVLVSSTALMSISTALDLKYKNLLP